MPSGYVETVYVDGRWTNWIGGRGPSHHLFDEKERAVAEGRRLAREAGVRHIVERTGRGVNRADDAPR